MKHRLVLVWVALVAITLAYAGIDRSTGTAVTVSAIALALVKFRVILREFMDVRHAPAVLRHATDAMVVLIAVALFASYVAGRAVA